MPFSEASETSASASASSVSVGSGVASPGKVGKTTGRAWYALALLTALYTLNSIDRNVVSITAEALKKEFHLSDSQLGGLVGFAYAVPFALAGLPLGLLVDRVNRSKFISLLLAVWSGLTFVSGLTRSFGQLLVARIGVAAAESGASPTCMSLITDFFPKERRSSALGWFYFSTPMGLAIGFAIGGLVVGHYGWRSAYFVAGVPGLLLALTLLLTLREPSRGAHDQGPSAALVRSSPAQIVRLLFARKTLLFLLLGAVIQTAAQAGVGAFLAPFFIRVHHVPVGQAGIDVAMALGGGAAVGMPLGGLLGDLLSKRSPRATILFVAAAMLIAGPCAMIAFASREPQQIVAWSVVYSALLATYYGPTFSNFLNIAPATTRGAVGALIIVACSLVGYGCGPPLVGGLSDLFHKQGWADPLRWGLTFTVCLYFVAALCFLLASLTISHDLKQAT